MARIRTDKAVDLLQNILDKIDIRIEEIDMKMCELEERAGDADRDLTTREQDRFDKWEEDIEDLRAEYDEVQNAIDYLMNYCGD